MDRCVWNENGKDENESRRNKKAGRHGGVHLM